MMMPINIMEAQESRIIAKFDANQFVKENNKVEMSGREPASVECWFKGFKFPGSVRSGY